MGWRTAFESCVVETASELEGCEDSGGPVVLVALVALVALAVALFDADVTWPFFGYFRCLTAALLMASSVIQLLYRFCFVQRTRCSSYTVLFWFLAF